MKAKTLRRRFKPRNELAIEDRRVEELAESLAWAVPPIPELKTWADCQTRARQMIAGGAA